ncbi:retrovirus-related Pol polyprotein from transposon gypsy [Trichonephila clavipes]|uniref:Retrovirus-related Pol polyprotein from transposon gypsy n=1 Tax=Trichonephila clavipes TaxID=2585209 RepID=A0A8X7BJN4_TRICX|nr:retrovirus-related Pol polyprotein from transposon gypsy [Trichonephila clavipes]
MQYQCILGIDFMKYSRLTLDFDKKSLVIPDDQIKSLPIVEKPVDVYLPDRRLDYPEAYRFAIDYRKLNAITKYPRYPLPLIDDLITNILFTTIMSTLDLKSGYFQLAINPRDIEETTFITRNGTFAFRRMLFGLSGAAQNFQKAIDIILKPVIGRFVSCYMDDVIITSPSFNEHTVHLDQVFTLLRDAGDSLLLEETHDNLDRFFHEFSFALRTAVNETTGKTPAELFLGRIYITPFRKLVRVTDGAEYVRGNIEKLFDEARQNMQRQHKTWEKYYNRKRRAVNIKVNDIVLVQTHILLVQRVGEWSESLCLNLKGPTECWKFRTTIGPFGKGEEGSQ